MGSTRNGIEFCFNSQTVLILLLLLKTVRGIELLSFNKKLRCSEIPLIVWSTGMLMSQSKRFQTSDRWHVPFLGFASGSLREFRVRISSLDTIGRGMMWQRILLRSYVIHARTGLMCPSSHGFTSKSELLQI